ncbi:alpha/beta hydrolase [Gemmatimonas groenlandica]|uniref:Esterase n=1 Tax=Gemmatimonas groenlandica TaxID=2732249 RepID=A0A6M4IS45_9BACT|nr:alpha/beta hydrolase-fold protein [Gemmatimonas groenlandica]QJR36559.1 hypothetical protein HKW67_14105 [Gemmatimonas groenlandica]
MMRRGRDVLFRVAAGLLAVGGFPSVGDAQAQTPARVLRIASTVLNETRAVHVQLPPNYAMARQRYPVVILLDGQVRAFFDLAVASTNYNLTGDAQRFAMPPQIVVGVEQGERSIDLARNADAFYRFLTTEVLPRVDREYRTMPFRTLIGHSLGARFALAMMCRTPTEFSAIIAISGALPDSSRDESTRCLSSPAAGGTATTSLRHLVISGGSLEPRTMASTDRLFTTLRDRLSAQSAPAWRIHRVDATGLEHTGAPLVGIPMGLRFVFDGEAWDLPPSIADSLRDRLGDPDALLAAGVAAVSARIGQPVAPTATWMATVVRTWLARRDARAALAAAERLVRDYPEQVDSHTLLADARELNGDLDGTRKAITAALDLSNRIAWHDERQKAAVQAFLRRSLAERAP